MLVFCVSIICLGLYFFLSPGQGQRLCCLWSFLFSKSLSFFLCNFSLYNFELSLSLSSLSAIGYYHIRLFSLSLSLIFPILSIYLSISL